MTREVLAGAADDGLDQVMEIMTQNRIRHLRDYIQGKTGIGYDPSNYTCSGVSGLSRSRGHFAPRRTLSVTLPKRARLTPV